MLSAQEQGPQELHELLELFIRDKAYIQCYFNLEKKDFHEKRAEMVRCFCDWTDFHERRYETIQLSIQLLDMYCSKKRVKQYEFDAIGPCCYFIAAKAVEIDPPTYSKLIKKIRKRDIPLEDWLELEANILSVLDWKLNYVLPCHFIGYFIVAVLKPQDEWRDLIELAANRLLEERFEDWEYHLHDTLSLAYAALVTATEESEFQDCSECIIEHLLPFIETFGIEPMKLNQCLHWFS